MNEKMSGKERNQGMKQKKCLSDTVPPRDCDGCPNSVNRRNVVYGEGPLNAKIMLVGEAPGETEDVLGRPFVGKAGKMLDHILKGAGLIREEIYITNVVKCRPTKDGKNRTPTAEEIEICGKYLQGEIEMVKPRVICPMGASALAFFLPGDSISRIHGATYDSWSDEIVLIPLYHPAVGVYDIEKITMLVKDMMVVTEFEKIEKPTIVVTTGEEGLGMSYSGLIDVETHSTACGKCGRTLTALRSVNVGYGPVCFQKIFGKQQPPAPGEYTKISKGSGKIYKIDLSRMIDMREWLK